jgi:hypothetical protein
LGLSARAWHRTLRVARTLADLDGSDAVRRLHIAEPQARAMADGLDQALREEVATKSDLAVLRAEFKSDLGMLKGELLAAMKADKIDLPAGPTSTTRRSLSGLADSR